VTIRSTSVLTGTRRRLFAAALAAAIAASVGALAPGASGVRLALPACPTQTQLDRRGAAAGDVSSPPQETTGKFPVTAALLVPYEQCSYQGKFSLLLVYWLLSPEQQAVAKAHFAYECRQKQACTVYLTRGTNTVVRTSPGGKATTKDEPTLAEVVISSSLSGEATATNPPAARTRCDELAHVLFGLLAGGAPVGKNVSSFRDDFDCP
jgi:hypothetical protein